MVAITTTASQLITTNGRKMSFVIEADAGNSTNNVRISSQDNAVAASFITLKAGQQQSYRNWSGTIYCVASANTPSVYVEMVDDTGEGYSQKDPGA